MSDMALGKKLNSQIANVPLNHLIWLQDYKTYGEDSYVFRDKRILKELYASPIAANDVQIYKEAKNYNSSYMSDADLIRWGKNTYALKDLPENIILAISRGDFSSWSDEDLSKILDAHYNNILNISDFVSVGDKRSITLSAMEAIGVGESHVEQTVEFAIADLDHDDLTTPINGRTKAAITLAQVGLLKNGDTVENGYMHVTNTVSSWTSCNRRAWCNDVYYNAIPTSIQSLVKAVDKLTSGGYEATAIATTSDKVWLFSEIEIFGRTYYSKSGEGSQYPYYATDSNRIKLGSNYWWERSPDISCSAAFCHVNKTGSTDDSNRGAINPFGVSPGLCI